MATVPNSAWGRFDIPILDLVPHTPAGTDLAGGTSKGILLAETGTITYQNPDGVSRADIPLAGGVIHRIAAMRVTAASTDVWIAY
jgi:hypothetical protein